MELGNRFWITEASVEVHLFHAFRPLSQVHLVLNELLFYLPEVHQSLLLVHLLSVVGVCGHDDSFLLSHAPGQVQLLYLFSFQLAVLAHLT